MTVIETIQTRNSCRTYSNRAIEPEKISELRQFLVSNTKTPFGSKVRFLLLDFNEMEIGELKKLTTYGVIKGARQFIVGTVEKQTKAMEDYGYQRWLDWKMKILSVILSRQEVCPYFS